jgi:fatty-acid desaturase
MRFAWRKTAWMYAMLVPAIAFGWGSLRAGPVIVAMILTIFTVTLGHTVGLHRGIIHGAYRTSPAFRRTSIVLFALTGLGGPLSWLRLHYVRDHAQAMPDAPRTQRYDHGLLEDAWWALHCLPIVDDWDAIGIPERDTRDPWLRGLDRGWFPLQLAQAAALLAIGGWDWLVMAWFVRNSVVILGHWFVGYVAHVHGTRRYRIDGVSEEGRNTWLLGVLSFGEGFHNNHHACPTSARIGRHWSEFDLGWLAILGLAAVGIVWDVNRPRSEWDFMRPGANLVGAESNGGRYRFAIRGRRG